MCAVLSTLMKGWVGSTFHPWIHIKIASVTPDTITSEDRIMGTWAYAGYMLSDYWPGHHLPQVQVYVSKDTTLEALRKSIVEEIDAGAVSGTDDRLIPDHPDSDAFYNEMISAVAGIEATTDAPFADIAVDNEDQDYPPFAFFVYVEE